MPQMSLYTLVAIALLINIICYGVLWSRGTSHRRRRASA